MLCYVHLSDGLPGDSKGILGLSESIWPLGLSGPTWIYLGLPGPIWAYLGVARAGGALTWFRAGGALTWFRLVLVRRTRLRWHGPGTVRRRA